MLPCSGSDVNRSPFQCCRCVNPPRSSLVSRPLDLRRADAAVEGEIQSHPIHVRHPGELEHGRSARISGGAGTSVDPVQLPAPDRSARNRLDRVEPGDRARSRGSSRAPRRLERRPPDRRDSRRARRPSAWPACAFRTGSWAASTGRTVGTIGSPPVRWRADRSMSCTRGRSRHAATFDAASDAGHRGGPGGAEHPHRSRVRRRGRGARNARPRAAARRHRTPSTPRDSARRNGSGRRRPRCSRHRMPSPERSSTAGSNRPACCGTGTATGPGGGSRSRIAGGRARSPPCSSAAASRARDCTTRSAPGSRRPRAGTADSWSTDRSFPGTANRSRRCSPTRASRSPASPTTRWERSARPMSSCCRVSRRAVPS